MSDATIRRERRTPYLVSVTVQPYAFRFLICRYFGLKVEYRQNVL
jgi:hypothetical protein